MDDGAFELSYACRMFVVTLADVFWFGLAAAAAASVGGYLWTRMFRSESYHRGVGS